MKNENIEEVRIVRPRGYQATLEELRTQIETDYFKTKDDLFKRIVDLRTNGLFEVIDNAKMRELLELYDKYHSSDMSSLEMDNYENPTLENKNLIVSKSENRILQTDAEQGEMLNEFKNEQNLLSVDKKSNLANDKEAFNNMSNKKIEMNFISLDEAIISPSINFETLNKIRFFITSGYTNPHVIKIDMTNGLFYNIETSDVYEVKYNPNTRQYEIYKNGTLDYTENQLKEEQEKTEENELDKPKVKVLRKEFPTSLNNAAFTKISFLILNTISIGLIITMILLLNK